MQRLGLMELPYAVAAVAVAATMLVVAVFYCLGALHNERRDRSILFWKSLPVGDLTAVLAKAMIPMVVMPLAVFAVIEVMLATFLLLNGVTTLAKGQDLAGVWGRLPFLQMQAVVLYTLVVTALWFAPIYAWLLLVSGWAKRSPFLWAFLPPLALALVERIAFQSSYVEDLLAYRLKGFEGGFSAAGGPAAVITNPLLLISPASFLSLPGLWVGLVVAAALLAGAVWFRRRREPI